MAFVFPEDKADFLAPNGVMYSWDGDKWRTKSFKADVEGDSGLMASVQRVEDNLDLLQDTVSTGEYIRAAKPGDPTGPKEGEAAFLQDGGAEATTFAEVENILLNKKGKGPYADFSSAKKGDYLLLQSAVDGDLGLYVIRNATEFDTFWDFGLEISASKVVGKVPDIGEGIVVRTSRPTFTVAQDTPPDFSSTGQLWFDTKEHTLKVWDEEAQEFVELGGGSDVNPDDYLKLSGGSMKGDIAMSGHKVTGMGDPTADAQAANKRYVDNRLKKSGGTGEKMTGDLYMGQHKIQGLADPVSGTDVANKKYVDTNFVPSAGGTFTGQLTVKYSGGDVPRFVVSNGDFHSFFVQTNHMAHCRGRVYVNSYMEDGGGQTGEANKLATIKEVKELAGGGPTTKYDGNRYCKIGLSTTTLSSGDVMFLNDQLVSEPTPSKIAALALPIAEFDWDKCAKSGIIKANNGSKNAGYYQVYELKENAGRNMIVYVKPLVVDDSVRHEDGGAPCYFQGVFFG